MAHQLNIDYLLEFGWIEVEGGFLPAELIGDPECSPYTLESALHLCRYVEKNMNVLAEMFGVEIDDET